MNEKKTQEIVAKRLAEKEQAQQAQPKQPETTSFRSILNNRQQTNETFKKFLG
jgi:hypothetical protein